LNRSAAIPCDHSGVFDDLIRRLDRIPKTQRIRIDLRLDEDGYLDRRCPAEECGAAFKVLYADWRDKVPDEQAWCAICGETGAPLSFATPDQMRQIREQGKAHVVGQLDDAFRGARKPKTTGGFISMTWSYKPGARPMVVAAEAAPLMTQRSACEACGCAYASVGAAFFCPACGHNSARTTFAGALAVIRKLMDLTDRMSEIESDRDVAADQTRHMAESNLGRVWASFQRFAEASYLARPGTTKPRRNAFQNLDKSNALWKPVIGKTYKNILDRAEYADLVRLVQARHILEHQDGIVDADYVARSGDHRYTVGQRLVVTVADTRRLAELAEKLSAAL
jgi:hypothetical protein